LQTFNIKTKAKVKSYANVEDVHLWEWMSDSIIGIVRETAAFHVLADAMCVP